MRLRRWWWLVLALLLSCNLPTAIPVTTPSLSPSPSPSPVPTSGVTTTPEVLPSPAATFTIPSALLPLQQALFLGDYERVKLEAEALLSDPNPQLRQEALWLRARALYAQGDYANALNTILRLLRTNPRVERLAQAYFLAGEIYNTLGRYAEADAAYRTYLVLRPGILDAFVQERAADAMLRAGDVVGALAAYEAAMNASRLDDGLLLRLKMARARIELGDYGRAIELCDQVIQESENDYLKAEAEYVAAEALEALGQRDAAQNRLQRAIHEYPRAYYAYQALVKLLDQNATVDDLARGIVDYYAGQYGVGLEAIRRYLDMHTEHDGTAEFYRALLLQAMGEREAALVALDRFLERYPSHPRWTEAWQIKVDWFAWEQGDFIGAANLLLQLAAARRNDPQAPDWLFGAGRFYERANDFSNALAVWESIANEYPSSSQAEEGLFQVALLHYRQKDFQAALTAFQRLLLITTSPEGRARAHFWIGKVHSILGDTKAAFESWRYAQSLDPTGYYSERARELLLGHKAFETRKKPDLTVNWEDEWRSAASWVRLTFNYPADLDLSELGSLAQDARWVRGREFWELGRYDEAHAEWDALRQAVSEDAAATFRLIEAFRRFQMYDLAILSARQVLYLAGLTDAASSFRAPSYFSHVRYGPYYAEVLYPLADQENIDVLLLLSLVRQESLFRSSAHSAAGAHGLMQILPDTAKSVASQLGWPADFVDEDLNRPIVNLRLGTYYLVTQRNYFGGDLWAALAAYNAGPGNALEWSRLAKGDPDLFVEVVRFEETRRYLRQIYEMYVIYRNLYAADNT